MDYFEPKISQKPVIATDNLTKWLIIEAYTPKSKQLKQHFTQAEYVKNPNNYLYFSKLKNEFICANKKCNSSKIKCIWFYYQPIDMRVDETFAEFYCPDCKKYTFVEYSRDDS